MRLLIYVNSFLFILFFYYYCNNYDGMILVYMYACTFIFYSKIGKQNVNYDREFARARPYNYKGH
jgi:hypothetical protein